MALLEPVLLLLLENFISFGLHSLLDPGACGVMGSEEVTVEQEPILTARGAAAPISVQEGPVAPWLCVAGSSVTQDSTSVPIMCAGWLGIEREARSPVGEGTQDHHCPELCCLWHPCLSLLVHLVCVCESGPTPTVVSSLGWSLSPGWGPCRWMGELSWLYSESVLLKPESFCPGRLQRGRKERKEPKREGIWQLCPLLSGLAELS